MNRQQVEQLRSYHNDIARHLKEVEYRRDNLLTAWHRLRTTYHGEGAEVFNERFRRTSLHFEQQTQRLHIIQIQLKTILEQLTDQS